jgi:hypothetical protein
MRPSIVSALFLLVLVFLPLAAQASLLCKGGSDQIAPDTARAGEPTVITFIVETAGSACEPIKGRFTEISLHYRLAGQDGYAALAPTPAPLPENYRRAASGAMQFEAYSFTVPPYADGTKGAIEYYIDAKFDGYASQAKGLKTIKIVSLKGR